MPHGAATVSILASRMGKPKIRHVAEANKALRFFKANAHIPLRFTRLSTDLREIRYGVYTDAAWANRDDNSSQGGFLVFAIDEEGID